MSERIVLLSVVLPFLCASVASAAETGMLYVKSEPPGATVLVDGEERGETPVLIRNVKAGHRVVEVRPADGPGVKDLVTVEAGKVANLTVRMRQEPASLTVISDPLEADVHLDRRKRGTAPVTIESIQPGEHEVILFLVDYERAVRKVTLQPGENRVLEVKLRRKGAAPVPDEKPPELAAMDETEKRLASVLGRFEAMVGKGDYAGARRLAAESARRGSLRDVATNLRAAASVAGALEARQEAIRKGAEALRGKKVTLRTKTRPRKGKVEEVTEAGITLATEIRAGGRVLGSTTFMVAWRELAPGQGDQLAKGWDRETADARIALAFLALARRDLAAAGRALDSAADHPLTEYVGSRIEATKRAPGEAAARKAWEEIEKLIGKAGASPAEAKKLLAKLDEFERRHGDTPTAQDNDERLERARARARSVLVAPLLARGLVGHWKFDEGRGEIARDSSRSGFHGQVRGATWTTDGRIGGALSFDGIDDYVHVGHSGALNAFPITISAWVLAGGGTQDGGIVNKYVSESYDGYQVWCAGGVVQAWYYRDPRNRVHREPVGLVGSTIADGRWHHVALTVDATGGNLYVDGGLESQLGWEGRPGRTPTTQSLSIGRYPGVRTVGPWHFGGLIDDVRIYNRALSAEEVRALARGE